MQLIGLGRRDVPVQDVVVVQVLYGLNHLGEEAEDFLFT